MVTLHTSYLFEVSIRHHIQIIAGALSLRMPLVMITREWFNRSLDRFQASDNEATLVSHLEVISLLIFVVLDI